MITIRAVTMEDADTLLSWRNDAVTRAASLSTAAIERPAHLAWLARTIEDPSRTIYLGSRDSTAVGTVRFDHDDTDAAEISITVAPAHRGRRLALPLLRAGLDAYAAEPGGAQRILARIREENTVSRALFAAADFHEISRIDGVLLLGAEQTARPPLSAATPS